MSSGNLPVGPSAHDWAQAPLQLTKAEKLENPEETIYELRKVIVINNVPHMQIVWVSQQQLRDIGIDHGL